MCQIKQILVINSFIIMLKLSLSFCMGLFTLHFQQSSEVTAALRRRGYSEITRKRKDSAPGGGGGLRRVATATPFDLHSSRKIKGTSQWPVRLQLTQLSTKSTFFAWRVALPLVCHSQRRYSRCCRILRQTMFVQWRPTFGTVRRGREWLGTWQKERARAWRIHWK